MRLRAALHSAAIKLLGRPESKLTVNLLTCKVSRSTKMNRVERASGSLHLVASLSHFEFINRGAGLFERSGIAAVQYTLIRQFRRTLAFRKFS
jgi:hypothetical protein